MTKKATTQKTKKTKKPVNYVDNKVFHQEMVLYIEQYRAWKAAEGTEDTKPVLSNFCIDCFIKIANRFALTPSFIVLPYKEELIGDAILNCIQYAHDYNPDKYQNPFAYFTQFVYFAFLRRIKEEQKQARIKESSLDNHILQMQLEGITEMEMVDD